MARLNAFQRGLVLVCLVLVSACARAPLKGIETAMRETSAPKIIDDLPLAPLLNAIEAQCAFLEKSPNFTRFVFGPETYSKEEYLAGLKRFVELGRREGGEEAFYRAVEEEFQFYEVYGQKSWGDAFISSYYEPVIEGSKKRTSKFSQALYREPDDLLKLDLSKFDEKFKDERKLRARLVKGEILPYFSRDEIDGSEALKGRGLELAWVDPIDAFILAIQGSGTVVFKNGSRMRVGYAEKNGHRYESIGKFVKNHILPGDVNLHTIEAYLRTLSAGELRNVLGLNPSYVFFKKMEESAVTSIGLAATDGRTIAADTKFAPKGGLAFLISKKPVLEGPEAVVPSAWVDFSRFVLDQDIGGGIQGSGRVDLFWGAGSDAKRFAGLMKQEGKLYYLAPKRLGR